MVEEGGGVRGTTGAEHRETEEQLDHQGNECLYEGRHVRTYPLVYMYVCVCKNGRMWGSLEVSPSRVVCSTYS